MVHLERVELSPLALRERCSTVKLQMQNFYGDVAFAEPTEHRYFKVFTQVHPAVFYRLRDAIDGVLPLDDRLLARFQRTGIEPAFPPYLVRCRGLEPRCVSARVFKTLMSAGSISSAKSLKDLPRGS
jgi:hypothetical protein